MTEVDRLRLALSEALGIAQRLRLLHEKASCAPFEVGTVIAELDTFVAALPPGDKFPAIGLTEAG